MELYFFASSFYGGRQPRVAHKMAGSLKTVHGQKFGSVSTDDLDEGSPNLESAIEIIENKIKEGDGYKEIIFFTGVTISYNIYDLYQRYPNSKIFMMKHVAEKQEKNDKLLIGKNYTDTSWIADYNVVVRQQMDKIVEENNLEWKPVDRPVFLDNGKVNYTPLNVEPETGALATTVNFE